MTPSPFIVGVGRSGTTLLRLMLDAHPELAIPPETHFILQLARESEDIPFESSDPRATFLELVTAHRTWGDYRISEHELRQRVNSMEVFDLGEALRVFYGLYAEKFGKTRWGDKTPIYVRRMMYIEKLLPEAHFVHVIRDGRDVALSSKGLWFGTNSVEEAAERWRSWIEHARVQARYMKRYKEIRYEDLVADTEPVLKEICQFLDLVWNPCMLDYHRTAEERMRELDRSVEKMEGEGMVGGAERMAIHSLTSRPPQRSRIGRWKSEMPLPERERFEVLAGDLLADLGYEVA